MHGKHIKVVGYGTPSLLGNPQRIETFLRELVKTLGMRMLGDPVIHDVEMDLSKLNVEPFEDEGGVTGTAVLSTSHCAIHTWPAREFFVLDVYSCRDFKELSVAGLLVEMLEAHHFRMSDLSAALHPLPKG